MVGECPKNAEWSEEDPPIELDNICSGIRMINRGATAAPEEIETARALLADVVKGLAHSLHHRMPHYKELLSDGSKKKLDELQRCWANHAGAGILVPTVRSDRPDLRVRIVEFTRAFQQTTTAAGATSPDGDDANDDDQAAAAEPGAKKARTAPEEASPDGDGKVEGKPSADLSGASAKVPGHSEQTVPPEKVSVVVTTLNENAKRKRNDDADADAGKGHPAPDPLLLAIRAAVNWSWRNNQKLLSSGEPEKEEDELDVLALEEFWQREELRPKTREDLARGLHQVHGYREG
jgi:hypothetical protein